MEDKFNPVTSEGVDDITGLVVNHSYALTSATEVSACVRASVSAYQRTLDSFACFSYLTQFKRWCGSKEAKCWM